MSQSKPIISIVIPTAPRRKKDLWRCLNSILKSDYKNWETIVIDNSGKKNYHKQIKKDFIDVRINIIKMPFNSGLLGLNIGLANAKGDYFMVLDDDAALRSNSLSKVVDKFSKLPKSVGVISCAVLDKTTDRCQIDLSKIDLSKTFRSFCGASVFKKEVFQKIGYFEDRFFCWNYEEDYSFRLIEAGYELYFASQDEILIDHYSKQSQFRGEQVFLQTRNKFWLNIKYFSWYLLPLIFCRDLIFISLQPIRRKTWKALIYAMAGYIIGVLTSAPFLKERRVLSLSLQKKYLHAQIMEDLISLASRLR